jgi:hypothetical protein
MSANTISKMIKNANPLIRCIGMIIYLSMLMTSNQVPAATFSLDRALWYADGWFLWVVGHGEIGSPVDLYVAGTDHLLASTEVNFQDRWHIMIYNPDFIPCSMRAESGEASAELAVSGAPTDCVDASSSTDPAPTNTAPSIMGTHANYAYVGQPYNFAPIASDADGDSLTFSITGQPPWASFNSSNGTLFGIPASSDLGDYNNISISVSDGNDSAMLVPFSITVIDPRTSLLPGAPVLSSADMSGTSIVLAWTEDNAIPEGGYDIIIDGLDTNSLYRTTLLTATVPDMDINVDHCFAIQARYTDTSQFLVSNQLCTQAIVSVNSPPLISGSPPTMVVESEFYSFTPVASDPDGDYLTFGITGKPAWANFDIATGTVSGIPVLSDVGVYQDIVIQVSDGSNTAALNPFNITVETGLAAGWADLSWENPTTRIDGSELPVNEIAGYRIWMGTSKESLHVMVDLNAGSATSYTVTDLSAGTYYFAITTYDTDNNESGLSEIVSKTIM